VLWTDNYVTLLPGQKLKVRGYYSVPTSALPLVVQAKAWNNNQ
jgi:hypothetical protein